MKIVSAEYRHLTKIEELEKAKRGLENYNDELLERYHKGGLMNADSNRNDKGQAYQTPDGKKTPYWVEL